MEPYISKTGVFADDRGLLFPLALEPGWIQSNISINKKWTFRGLHHQSGKHAQAKLISVVKGSIIDFLVDLRKNSFETTRFFRLQAGDQVYVPKGFAHGFLALEEDTIIQYLVDSAYLPEKERSFDWTSNQTVRELILAEVGDKNNLLISVKDSSAIKISTDFSETIDYLSI